MKRYTKENILELALHDPTVRIHIDAQRQNKGISWETMLHSLVVSLVEEKMAIVKLLIESKSKQARP